MISKTTKLLAERIQKHRRALWDWHMEYARKAPPPFYCSIDLRDSGYKIAPVDSNLYPAGFNNICPEDLRTAPTILAREIAKHGAHKVLILPEGHTKNNFYTENIHYLLQILRDGGHEAQVRWVRDL